MLTDIEREAELLLIALGPWDPQWDQQELRFTVQMAVSMSVGVALGLHEHPSGSRAFGTPGGAQGRGDWGKGRDPVDPNVPGAQLHALCRSKWLKMSLKCLKM